MIRILSILLFLTCLLDNSFAQGEWNNWVFGGNVGLNFVSSPPSVFLNTGSGSAGSMAVISDSSGQLLFYSNGESVYNRNHSLMQNGNGLFCLTGTFLSPVCAASMVGDEFRYYLFTIEGDPWSGNWGLYYSIVDMRLDDGLGGIVVGQKNIPVSGGEEIEHGIMGIRHENKRDFWLISQGRRTMAANRYLAFLVDKDGIHEPVISYSSVSFSIIGKGYKLAMNEEGTKLIGQFGKRVLEYCDFDASTGQVTPLFTYDFAEGAGIEMHLCFSWSGNKLYVSRWESGYHTYEYSLYQFDSSIADSTLFANSKIAIMKKGNYFGALSLGKDGKIYKSEYDEPMVGGWNDSIGIIRQPELSGMSCGFEPSVIDLHGKGSGGGFPQILQRYFAYIHHSGFCQGASICFEPNTWPPPDSLWWDFGDPSSGLANFSNDSTPEHIFNAPGIYTVKMIVRHVDMRYDTAALNLTIEPQPMPNLGPDRMVCQDQPVILNAGFNPQWTYLWSTGETTPTITVTNTGTYSVTVTSPNGCTGSDEVVLSIIPGSTPEPKPIKHN